MQFFTSLPQPLLDKRLFYTAKRISPIGQTPKMHLKVIAFELLQNSIIIIFFGMSSFYSLH